MLKLFYCSSYCLWFNKTACRLIYRLRMVARTGQGFHKDIWQTNNLNTSGYFILRTFRVKNRCRHMLATYFCTTVLTNTCLTDWVNESCWKGLYWFIFSARFLWLSSPLSQQMDNKTCADLIFSTTLRQGNSCLQLEGAYGLRSLLLAAKSVFPTISKRQCEFIKNKCNEKWVERGKWDLRNTVSVQHIFGCYLPD